MEYKPVTFSLWGQSPNFYHTYMFYSARFTLLWPTLCQSLHFISLCLLILMTKGNGLNVHVTIGSHVLTHILAHLGERVQYNQWKSIHSSSFFICLSLSYCTWVNSSEYTLERSLVDHWALTCTPFTLIFAKRVIFFSPTGRTCKPQQNSLSLTSESYPGLSCCKAKSGC